MSVLDPVIDYLDPSTKLVYLLAGVRSVHPVSDLYAEVRNLRRTDESLRSYPPQITAGGNIPKGGGKRTPRYAIFNGGWRLVPEDVSHTLEVTGEQLTEEGGSGPEAFDFTQLTAGVSVIVNYEPPAAEIIELSSALIEYSSFGGGITVDVTSPYSGTSFPIGTPQQPVNNLMDAHMIAAARGFTTFFIVGDLTIASGTHEGHSFVGESPTKTMIEIETAAEVLGVEFADADVTGALDGNSRTVGCHVHDLNYISGFIERCLLSGTISLGGTSAAYFLDCWTGAPGSAEVTIDLGGASGPDCVIRNLNGWVKLSNKSSAGEVSIDLASGVVEIDASVSAGTITIRGVGRVIDNSTGAAVVVDEVLDSIRMMLGHKILQNRVHTDPATGIMTVYDDDDVTPLLTANLYEDVAAATPYGPASQRIDRRDRLA